MNRKIKAQWILGKVLRRLVMVFIVLTFFACKGDDQLKGQVSDLTAKLEEANKKISDQDGALKSATGEIKELKELVAKLGNAVVDLRKANEPKKKVAVKTSKKTPSKKPSHRRGH
ncbi:MAG TPA: hypothetical protein PLH57_02285 [Oligoflexia bacterium]|nr:hypothetical protein [Oligoflexia bacterium]